MPLALGIIALLIFVTAVKGNYAAVGAQFNETFITGSGQSPGFGTWAGSIIGLAIIFRAIQAPKAGELFIAIVILVYFLKNNNLLGSISGALSGAAGSTGQTG
jgi:hypothetical protein